MSSSASRAAAPAPIRIRWIAAHRMMVGMVVSSGPARAEGFAASVTSPDQALRVTVVGHGDGQLRYALTRHGKELIAPSRLGFAPGDAWPDAGFTLLRQSVTIHDDSREPPSDQGRHERAHYHQLRLDLVQAGAGRRAMAIVFRVFDDGIGFRFELPWQGRTKRWETSAELTEFAVAPSAMAWWQQAGEAWARAYPVQQSALAEVGLAGTPLTVRTVEGVHIAFLETAVAGYPPMWLRKVAGQTMRVQLAPAATGRALDRGPWRVLQIAGDAAGLAMSDLPGKLSEADVQGRRLSASL